MNKKLKNKYGEVKGIDAHYRYNPKYENNSILDAIKEKIRTFFNMGRE
jgi:hypothetical protein